MGFSGQPNLSQSIFGTGLGERCRNTRKRDSYILYTRSGVPNGRQTTNRFFLPKLLTGLNVRDGNCDSILLEPCTTLRFADPTSVNDRTGSCGWPAWSVPL